MFSVCQQSSVWMHIKFIGPLNCLGGVGGAIITYFYWSCVYKYITGNAWVSALKKGMLISVLSPAGYFFWSNDAIVDLI